MKKFSESQWLIILCVAIIVVLVVFGLILFV